MERHQRVRHSYAVDNGEEASEVTAATVDVATRNGGGAGAGDDGGTGGGGSTATSGVGSDERQHGADMMGNAATTRPQRRGEVSPSMITAGKRRRTVVQSYDEATRRQADGAKRRRPRERCALSYIANARGGGHGPLAQRIQIGPTIVRRIEESARMARTGDG